MLRSGRRVAKSPFDGVAVDVSEKNGIRSLHLGSEAIQSSMRVRERSSELVLLEVAVRGRRGEER